MRGKDSKEGNKEVLLVVDAVSNEKGVNKEVIFSALEAALASAAKKRYTGEIDVRVVINRRTGGYTTFRRWTVVADNAVEHPDRQLPLTEARKVNANAQVGDTVETPLENADFGGRIAAQIARQIILQKVRDAERAKIVDAYLHRKGELIRGIVKRVERGDLIIDVGDNIEAKIAQKDLIPRDSFRVGQPIRGYLKDVRSEQKGPQLFVSRTVPEFLIALITLEVPEISQGVIEIKGVARDPGSRAKIAVKSKDARIDPVSACIGMRKSRVESVSNELAGERIDIVRWDEDPVRFVMNAMAPAEVNSVIVDEDTHSMDIIVSEEQSAKKAIGKGGQNVQLASQLTGWKLAVITEKEAHHRRIQENAKLQQMFIESLDINEETAAILVREGFSSLEEVAYVPTHEMLEIAEFNQELVDELRGRARDVLLTRAIAAEERLSDAQPSTELLSMAGMNAELAFVLARHGIITTDDLAELAVDDLCELAGLSKQQAAQLIMTARAPWFSSKK